MVPLAFFYGLVPALWAVGRGMDGEGGVSVVDGVEQVGRHRP